MEGMKGIGRTIASFVGSGNRIELLAYPDGSMGILCNAAKVGVWERAEQEDCLRTFMKMGTAREPISALVLVHSHHDSTFANAPVHFAQRAAPPGLN